MLASYFRVGLNVTEGVPPYAKRRGDMLAYYTGHSGEDGTPRAFFWFIDAAAKPGFAPGVVTSAATQLAQHPFAPRVMNDVDLRNSPKSWRLPRLAVARRPETGQKR
jgi:hypothetical protein